MLHFLTERGYDWITNTVVHGHNFSMAQSSFYHSETDKTSARCLWRLNFVLEALNLKQTNPILEKGPFRLFQAGVITCRK